MELELKHLAAYLPYGLKLLYRDESVRDLLYLQTNHTSDVVHIFKPILRNLSDLTKEIEVNGERFVPIDRIGKMSGVKQLERFECDDIVGYGWTESYGDDGQGYELSFNTEKMTFGVWADMKDDGGAMLYEVGGYNEVQKLLEWHFDIYGLIESGLAIDINTLNS